MNILFLIESRREHMMDCYSDDRLMAEHLSRGHDVWASEPIDLILKEGALDVLAYRYHRLEHSVSFIDPTNLPDKYNHGEVFHLNNQLGLPLFDLRYNAPIQ